MKILYLVQDLHANLDYFVGSQLVGKISIKNRHFISAAIEPFDFLSNLPLFLQTAIVNCGLNNSRDLF